MLHVNICHTITSYKHNATEGRQNNLTLFSCNTAAERQTERVNVILLRIFIKNNV